MDDYNKLCIHIQTYTPHFIFTDKLINSFIKLTNICELKIPIFVIVDDASMINDYKNTYKYDYEFIYFLNLNEIINNINLPAVNTEKFNNLFKSGNANVQWGAGGHRNYVAVKRTYSILELKNKGFDYVWCLDSESLILKNVNIKTIFDCNIIKPLLLIGINPRSGEGVKYKQIVEELFNFNFNDFKDISVRMNDFWFIHTKYFHSMILLLFNIHKKPISYFVNGSEQSLYEYYIYHLYLKNNNDINVIEMNVDLHGNGAFNDVIYNENIDINSFCDTINNSYFNYVQSYRGDYYQYCLKFKRGQELINKLNISIAVSNYSQGPTY